MRKSDYPQYYGGKYKSRGPRTFKYWFHMAAECYPNVSIKRKRWLLSNWLEEDS